MADTLEYINPSVIEKEKNGYLLLCIDDMSWWLGKIKSFSPRAKGTGLEFHGGSVGLWQSEREDRHGRKDAAALR